MYFCFILSLISGAISNNTDRWAKAGPFSHRFIAKSTKRSNLSTMIFTSVVLSILTLCIFFNDTKQIKIKNINLYFSSLKLKELLFCSIFK